MDELMEARSLHMEMHEKTHKEISAFPWPQHSDRLIELAKERNDDRSPCSRQTATLV
jgi:hypothetical protein